jgi:hypothetical protein
MTLLARATPVVLCALLVGGGARRLHAQSAKALSSDTVVPLPYRALRDLLADASTRNVLPRSLISYKSQVQTEIAVLLRREEGTEAVTLVEQVASALRWTRSGYYDQHVVGYRAQQAGGTFSMLSIFQTGWLQPALYGNRLRVTRRTSAADAARNTARTARADGADTLPAIHPLSTDRDAYYRYTGGDTVVTMQVGDRRIPIVHVRVQPREDVRARVLLFDGELDLDASRGALVRMRGNFVRLNGPRGPPWRSSNTRTQSGWASTGCRPSSVSNCRYRRRCWAISARSFASSRALRR